MTNEASSPPEALRGRKFGLVFGGIGVVALIISLTVPDNNKDWRGLLMVTATFMGPVVAFFGILISTIAAMRARPWTRGHLAALALNIALMLAWMLRWGRIV